jgi:hypothetical protein
MVSDQTIQSLDAVEPIWSDMPPGWTDPWRKACREARKHIPVSHGCEECWEESERTQRVTKGVRLESSRTMYPFDGVLGSKEDPNRPRALCRRHAREHHKHWDEMWADYYGGRL